MMLTNYPITQARWSFLPALHLAEFLSSHTHQPWNGGLQVILLSCERAVAMEGGDEGKSGIVVGVDFADKGSELLVLFSVTGDPGFE